MDSINKLIQLFSDFPGIGPRQAKRFVYFLLSRDQSYLKEISRLISELKNNITSCRDCFRFFAKNHSGSDICSICSDKNRDDSTLMIVSRDIDLENVERSQSFKGKYFILGGTIPILEKMPEKKIRSSELARKLEDKKEIIKEIILATNLNTEGENTADYIIKSIGNITEKNSIKVSKLGRGLSTGTELEYSDSETIINALKNRQ